ncbi:MAG TPA: hypothetical protein V6D17_18175 [Candidatus Obscuribacterales bacterium]
MIQATVLQLIQKFAKFRGTVSRDIKHGLQVKIIKILPGQNPKAETQSKDTQWWKPRGTQYLKSASFVHALKRSAIVSIYLSSSEKKPEWGIFGQQRWIDAASITEEPNRSLNASTRPAAGEFRLQRQRLSIVVFKTLLHAAVLAPY